MLTLTTKLHIPSLRRNLVPRQRLLERLDQGLRRRLTLVSAPAGFGKTTLLTEWVQSLESHRSPPMQAAWVSLDDGDNDPARFSAHLTAALQRTDTSIPLPRLRARGQLTELRQSDLRFTTEEGAAFLNNVMGLALSAEDVAALEARTEGWIAGLQMASLAMRARLSAQGQRQGLTHDARSEFIQAFTGSHRFILDCLGEEVLEHLEATNLFIVPLDDERRWYRYHHLFSDLLRKRLWQTSPDLVPALHSRASAGYEQEGLMAAAIDHALAARDFERAATLIEENVEATLMRPGS